MITNLNTKHFRLKSVKGAQSGFSMPTEASTRGLRSPLQRSQFAGKGDQNSYNFMEITVEQLGCIQTQIEEDLLPKQQDKSELEMKKLMRLRSQRWLKLSEPTNLDWMYRYKHRHHQSQIMPQYYSIVKSRLRPEKIIETRSSAAHSKFFHSEFIVDKYLQRKKVFKKTSDIMKF